MKMQFLFLLARHCPLNLIHLHWRPMLSLTAGLGEAAGGWWRATSEAGFIAAVHGGGRVKCFHGGVVFHHGGAFAGTLQWPWSFFWVLVSFLGSMARVPVVGWDYLLLTLTLLDYDA